jgi:cytochrome bd-type quinol oxidase subunit 2
MHEREHSIAHLFSTLMHDLSLLVRQEIRLVKTEASEKAGKLTRGATFMVAGGLVAFAGFLFLLVAATYALQTLVSPWLAALIVGVAVVFVGAVMLMAGRSRLKAEELTPQRSIESVREDATMARHHLPRGNT